MSYALTLLGQKRSI